MGKAMLIYDHTNHPIWRPLYDARHLAHNRTNGGYTYSEDIVKFHIPVIKKVLEQQNKYKNVLITTVGILAQNIVQANTDLIIYYLHEFLEREYPNIQEILSWYKGKIIFITSRRNIYEKLKSENINVILLPMSIDTSALADFTKSEKYNDKRVIYFGNRYLGKGKSFEIIKQSFIDNGWIFDCIAFNKFNENKLLTRQEIFDTIATYRYGIGEGRCFLEMNALGVKTLICAGSNQGIITNEDEFTIQRDNNFSDGKVWTFSKSIQECIDNFDKAIIKTVDVSEILPILEQGIREIVNANN